MMEYYSAIRRKQILPFATIWMELEGIMLSEISGRERQVPNDFIHLWSTRTKQKLKGQNSSRLTDSKKGTVVTKGEVGWGGRRKRIEEYYHWRTWCVGGHGEISAAQRRQVVTLWHLTRLMDSDCNGVWGGLVNMGECSKHNVFM